MEQTIMFKSLIGSYNYNLNDNTSDKDYKLFICPSFDDLYNNKIISKSINSLKEDVETKDIRLLISLLVKANPAYLEILFSTEVIFYSEKAKTFYLSLINIRESLIKNNLKRFFDSTFGCIMEKNKNLFKSTDKTQHLFDKFGYNNKNNLHIYRLYDLLLKYHNQDYNDFNSCLYYDDINREKMLNIKYNFNKLSIISIKQNVEKIIDKVKKLEKYYYLADEKIGVNIRNANFNYLNNLVYDYIKCKIKNELY